MSFFTRAMLGDFMEFNEKTVVLANSFSESAHE